MQREWEPGLGRAGKYQPTRHSSYLPEGATGEMVVRVKMDRMVGRVRGEEMRLNIGMQQ